MTTPEEVRQEVKALDRAEHRNKVGYQEVIADIGEARDKLQRDCPHENVKKGSRSGFRYRWYDSCLDCGADLETGNGEVDRG